MKKTAPALQPFVRAHSAALFVGVGEFAAAPSMNGVRYTVDDAVDLAYTFALDRQVSLVDPHNVVLALTHEPQNNESRQRLQKLLRAGARRTGATREQVLALVEAQARVAGEGGLLILSFASHGFSREGTPYILASNSRYDDTATSLSASKISDIASASKAQRSLIFIDACRERLPGTRTTSAPPLSPTVLKLMKGAIGQVIFYAAAPGQYAYEDERAQNGVFTEAVINGLVDCRARTVEGVVTVEKLARHVEDRVRTWVHKNRNNPVPKATEMSMDADTKAMPLAWCMKPPQPVKTVVNGRTFAAFAENRTELWSRTLASAIEVAHIADIDGDKSNEVLVSDGATITAFDALGTSLWSVNTAMPVRSFRVEHAYSVKRKQQVIALSSDDRHSTISLIDHDGMLLAAYTYTGKIQQFFVDRMTARHERKIIVTAAGGHVFLIDPDPQPRTILPIRASLGSGAEVWWGSVVSSVLTKLTVIDFDNDGTRELALKTPRGRVYVSFDGKIVSRQGEQFQLFERRRSGSR